MGFGDFLRTILIYITYFLIWQIARWGVLPHVQIFPYIPPNTIWETLYSIFITIATFIFWFGVLLIIFLYCVYLFVILILRFIAIPFGAIIAEILLNITPLKDLRDLGLIDLIESLLQIIFSFKPFGQRFTDFFKALFTFLLRATGLDLFINNRKQELKKSSQEETNDGETPKPNDENDEDYEEVNGDGADGANGEEKKDKNSTVSPPLDIGGNTDEERLVQANYEKCYIENYIPITDDMSSWEKMKTSQKNSVNSSKCGIQLIKDKTKIESMKQYKK